MAATNGAAAATGLPEDPILLRARLAEVEARYAESQVQFRELRTWYDKLKRQHRELLWSEAVLAREGLEEALPGPPVADADRADGHIGGGFVLRHHLGAGAFAAVYGARASWPSRSSSVLPTSTPCGSWPTTRSTSGAP